MLYVAIIPCSKALRLEKSSPLLWDVLEKCLDQCLHVAPEPQKRPSWNPKKGASPEFVISLSLPLILDLVRNFIWLTKKVGFFNKKGVGFAGKKTVAGLPKPIFPGVLFIFVRRENWWANVKCNYTPICRYVAVFQFKGPKTF